MTARAQTSGALPHGSDDLEQEHPPNAAPAAAAPAAAQPATGPAAAPATAPAVAAKTRNCFVDLTAPPGGNGHFVDGAPLLYLLAQLGKDDTPQHAKSAKTEPHRSKYVLLKINLKSRKSTRIVAFSHLPGASLLTFGTPIEAAAAVAFAGKDAGCYSGPAALVQVSFTSKEHSAIKASGTYELVETPSGRLLVDLAKQLIVSVDAETFQRRGLQKVEAAQRALYFDPQKKLLVTWTALGEQRGLDLTAAGSQTRHLPVPLGDRVLQNGSLFGSAHLSLKENTITFREVATWSGVGKDANFTVQVPAAYPVANAGVDINFSRRMALVYGANFAAKQKWQRVFVFDYAKGQMLGGVPVTGNDYLHFAAIDPTGSYAFVEVRDRLTRATTGAKIFDIAKKTFDDVTLDLPASGS